MDAESLQSQPQPSTKKRSIMIWTEDKDDMLLREVMLFEPFKFKPRTKERGTAWKAIADNLNKYDSALFKVDQRSVRERFGILKARVESKNREELGATGIAPDVTAVDQAMEDIIERIKEYEKQHEEEDSSKIEKNEKEKEAAADMRLKALETFSVSKKRREATTSEADGVPKEKKPRSSGTDTLTYLREKAQQEKLLKGEELALKKQKYETQAAQQKANEKQQQDMVQTFRDQLALQQNQNQQMLALMAQLLQNNNASNSSSK